MVKKKSPVSSAASRVTRDRASRLHRLLRLLTGAGQTRAVLLRKLDLTVRGFYRDLESLRDAGIAVELARSRYVLVGDPAAALEMLPFPDPGLSIGEARTLAKGRSAAHKKLQALLARLET